MFSICRSLPSGVFSSALKNAEVVSFHKKDSKLDFCNYLPISLLSNLDTTLEKLMYTRISEFFSKNKLFYPLKFGFRQKCPTTHALISLTENIMKYLDE